MTPAVRFVCLAFAIISVVKSSDCTWKVLDGPISRAYASIVTIEEYTYVIGGYDSTTSSYVGNVDRYLTNVTVNDSDTSYTYASESMQPMPSLRQGHSCSATFGVGAGFIYCSGGFRSERRQDEADKITIMYRIATNDWVGIPEDAISWMALSTTIFQIGAGTTAVGFDQGGVYILGGSRFTTLRNSRGYRASAIVSRWDITQQLWQTSPEIPSPRYSHASVQTGGNMGHLWVIGGKDEKGVAQSSMFRYHERTETWDTMTPMPMARFAHSVSNTNDDAALYIIGGLDAEDSPLSSVIRYDIVANNWTEFEPLPYTVHSHDSTMTQSGGLWLHGGVQSARSNTLSTLITTCSNVSLS